MLTFDTIKLGDFKYNTSLVLYNYITFTPERCAEVQNLAAVIASRMLDLNSEESINSAKYDIMQGIHEMYGGLSDVFNSKFEDSHYFTLLKVVMEDQIEWETIAEPYFNEALENERKYRMK